MDKLLNEEEIVAAAMKLAGGRAIVKQAGWAGSGWTKVYAVMVREGKGYLSFMVDTFGDVEKLDGENKRVLWQRVTHSAAFSVSYGR